MRHYMRGLLLALVIVLCLTQGAGAEGSLLANRMNRAYESGRRVEATLGAELGGGLDLFLPEGLFGALEQLLAETRIQAHWAEGADGEPEVGLRIGIQDVELLTGAARLTGAGAEIETSLLPGKVLLVPLDNLGDLAAQQALPVQIDDEMADVFAQAFMRYSGIAMEWAQQGDGLLTQTDGPVPGTDVRSEAAQSMQVRVGAAQLQDLLVRLTGEFEGDAALQDALESALRASGGFDGSMSDVAKALSEGARDLVPLDGALTMDSYLDAEGELVGLDMRMEPMFEGSPESLFAQYDRLDEDGRTAYGFQGRMGLADGGQAAAKINHSVEESHLRDEEVQNLLLLGMVQPTGDEPINQITLTDRRETALEGGREQMSDTISFTMESFAPDGAALEDAMPVRVVIGTRSATNEREGDDFDATIDVSLQALEMEFLTLNLALASGEREPIDTSGSTVIDLSTADEEEQAALMEELQAGLGTAIMNAMQVLPPELLQMMLGE